MIIVRNESAAAIVPWLLLALATGCATQSTTSGGETTAEVAGEEHVAAPPVTEIPPNDSATAMSRTSPPMIAELTQRNSSGSSKNYLLDVLFDFDQHTLRLDSQAAVETNAKRLKEDGAKTVLLEGRADEVGTEEYNMVLGERRALGVKQYLETLGISVTIDTTSYGKERPLCFEHSLDCWQKNRSVHFVVKE